MTVLSGLKAMLGFQRGGAALAEGAGTGQSFAALMAAHSAATSKAAGEAAAVAEGTAPALPDGQAVQPGLPEGQPLQFAEPSAPATSVGAAGEAALSAPAQDAPRLQGAVAKQEGATTAAPADEQPVPASPSLARAVDKVGDASPVRIGSKVHKPSVPAKTWRQPDPAATDAPHAAIEAAAETGAPVNGTEEIDEDRTADSQASNVLIVVMPASPSPITSLPSQHVAASGESVPSAPVALAVQGQAGDPQPSPAPLMTADAPTIDAKPLPPVEAAALLQIVRDHVKAGRKDMAEQRPSAPARGGENLSAVAGPPVASLPVVQAPILPAASPALVAMPTVDLSASIVAQVVDMGVSGQWIDGLAREIAGLSTHGAQGRFQIDAAQLGPIQVDIRQSAEGAAVSLTVANDFAEQALRQDSDRLKLDAGLSAVRISEVRVERAPAAEAARNDGTGAQSSGQGQGHSSAHAQSHSQTQSHPHGRGRARENIVLPHKDGGEATVLNHEQGGAIATDLPRARYA